MVFDFDENEREYICWLLDDAGRGYFSPTGYNRDLLASHFEQPFFIIKDPELYADIKLRNEYLKKSPPVIDVKQHKAFTTNIHSGMSIEEIDNQIEFLRQRKDQIIKIDASSMDEENQKNLSYEKLKKEKEKKGKFEKEEAQLVKME
jgi:hypothetical protein